MTKRLLWGLYVGPMLFWMMLIFMGSSRAGSSGNSSWLIVHILNWFEAGSGNALSPETLDRVNLLVRKAAHISEYAVLTLLAVRAMQFGKTMPRLRAVFGGPLVALLYAASDEFHQSFVPGRTPAVHDVLIDGIGILFITTILILWALTKQLESKLRSAPAP